MTGKSEFRVLLEPRSVHAFAPGAQKMIARAGRALAKLRKKAAVPYLSLQRTWRRRRIIQRASSKSPITLFLAPEAGLKPYYASHAILARLLQDEGHAVAMLSCRGVLPICSVKFAMQLGPTKPADIDNAACRSCLEIAPVAGSRYDLPDISIESILSSNQLAAIEGILGAEALEPWNIMYDGVEFGAICSAEVMRSRRKINVGEFTPDDVLLLKRLIWSSLALYISISILADTYKVERLVYFGDYAYWITAQILASRLGIQLVNVSHGYIGDIDRRRLMLREGNDAAYRMLQMDVWPKFCSKPINSQIVSEILQGALYRLGGHGGASTYSPNWIHDDLDLLKKLDLRLDRKTIVAYTSSSDEIICMREYLRVLGVPDSGQRQPFDSQEEWLQKLTEWVSLRPELQLIIRIHPRMATSHRHLTVATEYGRLRALLANLPSNVVVIWPEDKLSSYNLAEIADAVLIAWTSMGLELARLGVPVVAAFRKLETFPTGGFIAFNETSDGYFSEVDTALRKPADVEAITEAFRWTYFYHLAPLVDVSDIVPEALFGELPVYKTPKRRDVMLKAIVDGLDVVDLNMALLSEDSGAHDAERTAMLSALRSMIMFLMSGELDMRDVNLLIELDGGGSNDRAASCAVKAGCPVLRVEGGGTVTLFSEGQVFRRRSALVTRLANCLLVQRSQVAGAPSIDVS